MDHLADNKLFRVLINGEEQYSIWPADRGNPPGWIEAGMQGSREECIAYVDQNWTDMRPLSLRRRMDLNDEPA